jgi:CRP/FNR family cyclic AMP-dependent transcriptional regulator
VARALRTAPAEPEELDDIRIRSMIFHEIEDARRSMLSAVRSTGGHPQSFPRGTFLLHQGDIATAAYVVDRGHVKVGRLLRDGSQVILKVAPAGDFIGFVEAITELRYTRYACAVTDVLAWRLDHGRILELLDTNREFSRAMLMVNSMRFVESQISLTGLRTGPLRSRLIQLLMKMAHETTSGCRDGTTIDLELNQEEMATIIGTTRQSVSSLLSSLKRSGLIRAEHRAIEIPAWDPLLTWGHCAV